MVSPSGASSVESVKGSSKGRDGTIGSAVVDGAESGTGGGPCSGSMSSLGAGGAVVAASVGEGGSGTTVSAGSVVSGDSLAVSAGGAVPSAVPPRPELGWSRKAACSTSLSRARCSS